MFIYFIIKKDFVTKTPYFWCIIKQDGERWVDAGINGWAKSQEEAFHFIMKGVK